VPVRSWAHEGTSTDPDVDGHYQTSAIYGSINPGLPPNDATLNYRNSYEFSADNSRYLVTNRYDPNLYIWRIVEGPWGETDYQYEGSCQPFGPTGRLSGANFNPANSDQVVIGDYSYVSQGGTGLVRVVNIASISGSSCATDAEYSRAYIDQVNTVTYNSAGTKIFALAAPRVYVWDVAAPTTPQQYWGGGINGRFLGTTEAQIVLNADESRLTLSQPNNHVAIVLDLQYGTTLSLSDDEYPSAWTGIIPTFVGFSHIQTNQLIVGREGYYNFGTGTLVTQPKVFRWDISAWNPQAGNATWYASTATSTQLLQTFEPLFINPNGELLERKNSLADAFIKRSTNELYVCGNTSASFYDTTCNIYGIDPTTGAISETATEGLFFRFKSHSNFQIHPTNDDVVAHYFFDNSENMSSQRQQRIAFYNISSTRKDNIQKSPFTDGGSGSIYSIAYSSDGRRVLTGDSLNRVVIWDAFSGAMLKEFTGFTAPVTKAVFSSDDMRILAASKDNTAILFDSNPGSLNYGKPIRLFDISNVDKTNAISDADYDDSFTPARIALVTTLGQLRIFDEFGGSLLNANTPLGSANPIHVVDFSDDGTRLALGSVDGPTYLSVYDTLPGSSTAYQKLTVNYPRNKPVSGLKFIPGSALHLVVSTYSGCTYWTCESVFVYLDDGLGNFSEEIVTNVGLRTFNVEISNSKHGYIIGTDPTSSGQGRTAIAHLDLDPANKGTTYGKVFTAGTGALPPIGIKYYLDNSKNNSAREPINMVAVSPDGEHILGAQSGTSWRPSWSDFDTYFNVLDAAGYLVRPNETVSINPVYAWPTIINGSNGD
ncbi:MAG: hypothetical protein OEZ47_17290, partial [Gammaproteobacteria bacterium]|nr:hypothetical protein [Gammaproteobacteria bacterium]